MPAPKTLEQHVRDVTFRARRHRDLLESAPVLPWPKLALLQSGYAATDHELERRALAVEFEQAIRTLADDADEQAERKAEEAEFDALIYGAPEEVDDDSIGHTIDHAHRTLLARELRNGAIRGRRLTFREIADELGVSASTARRLVAFVQRGAAASG